MNFYAFLNIIFIKKKKIIFLLIYNYYKLAKLASIQLYDVHEVLINMKKLFNRIPYSFIKIYKCSFS